MRIAQKSRKFMLGCRRGHSHLRGQRGGSHGGNANRPVKSGQFLTGGNAASDGAGIMRLGIHGGNFHPLSVSEVSPTRRTIHLNAQQQRQSRDGPVAKSCHRSRIRAVHGLLSINAVNRGLSNAGPVFQKPQSFSIFIGNLYSLFTPAVETAPN
jgi:hypothetical protein